MFQIAGALPFGGSPARRAGWPGTRGRLALAFALSGLLHGAILWRAHWPAGDLKPEGGRVLIEARLVTSAPPDRDAAPTSRPVDPPPPAPRPAEPAAAAPLPPVPPLAAPTPQPPVVPAAKAAITAPAAPVPAPVAPAPAPAAQPAPAPAPASPPGQESAVAQAPAVTSPSEPKLDLPPAPAEYHPLGALDPPPRILSAGDPAYPPDLKAVEGMVVLRVLLGTDGRIEALQVGRSTPPGVFDASALNAFAAAKFSPGYIAGVAVKSQMTIEVKYTPANRIVTLGGSYLR